MTGSKASARRSLLPNLRRLPPPRGRPRPRPRRPDTTRPLAAYSVARSPSGGRDGLNSCGRRPRTRAPAGAFPPPSQLQRRRPRRSLTRASRSLGPAAASAASTSLLQASKAPRAPRAAAATASSLSTRRRRRCRRRAARAPKRVGPAERCREQHGPAAPEVRILAVSDRASDAVGTRGPGRFPNEATSPPPRRPPSARPRRLLLSVAAPRRPRQAGRGAVAAPQPRRPRPSTPASPGRREQDLRERRVRQRRYGPGGGRPSSRAAAARRGRRRRRRRRERLATAVAALAPLSSNNRHRGSSSRRAAICKGGHDPPPGRRVRTRPAVGERTAAPRCTPPLTKATAPLYISAPRPREVQQGEPTTGGRSLAAPFTRPRHTPRRRRRTKRARRRRRPRGPWRRARRRPASGGPGLVAGRRRVC